LNLCIDIGSTNIKLGIFSAKRLKQHLKFKKYIYQELDKVFEKYQIDRIILCTVRKRSARLVKYLEKRGALIELTEKTSLPITNKYGTPKTLGKDRLASAVGAYMRKPHQFHLMINTGTCITMDIMTDQGEYLGGNISPGMNLRIKAMHDYTANLPIVKPINPKVDFGYNTVTALQNGAVMGTILEVEAFISRMKAKYPLININLTGGYAEFLAKYLESKIFVRPYLVLEGLNEILLHNVK